MRIERKLIFSSGFNVGLIILIGLFAFQNLNLVLTKLRFVEIADDLNASFLEMRLSEKNYFLYRDESALFDIKAKIDKTADNIELVKNDIARAIGSRDLDLLMTYLKQYAEAVEETRTGRSKDTQMELKIRNEGKRLKEFSESVTRLERAQVNEIISDSKKILLYSFIIIFLLATTVSHFLSQKILRPLREIEKLARAISGGNFSKIHGLETRDELGSVIRAINLMSEELRNREEEILQSKKLASLGILTAGVAHELTNPLNNISMIAQTYAEVYDTLGREQRLEFMSKVEGETERIREIVKNLLDFSKPKEANLKEADINAVIRGGLKLVQNMLDISTIDTRLALAEGLPRVFIDEHQIQQVLVNLIVNAAQAMSAGGELAIVTRYNNKRHVVEIDIKDTGKGIPREFLPHVFDPFFSTKGVGGTGLGLSVSYGIVKNHKGTIRVESTVGAGTLFTIELPVNKV